MLLNIPKPVQLTLGQSYSLLDLAIHITATDSRYNRSADEARSGVRIVSAIQVAKSGKADVHDEDLRLFAEAIEKPTRGWGSHEVRIPYRDPRTGETKDVVRRAQASTREYLPLIDAVTNAAKSLPAQSPAKP